MSNQESMLIPNLKAEPAPEISALSLPGSPPASLVDPEAVALARELEAARMVQKSLLPSRFPPLAGYHLTGFCRSARHVSGDFYDAVPLRPGAVLLVVADVMGKGVPAALFAATLRALVRTMGQWTQRPADMLGRINALLGEELSEVDMFITAQLAVVDTVEGSLRVASAGHLPLLLTDGRGQVEPVTAQGLPLGVLANCTFTETCLPLSPSAYALLYTDGLTEAQNLKGERLGGDALQNWLSQNAACGLSADQSKERLIAELTQFQGATPTEDDQTFLLLAPAAVCSGVNELQWSLQPAA